MECVKRNLSRVVGIMYRARHILGTEHLLTLYYSLFLPILSYCCEMLGITYTSTIHCIKILQKILIRLISGVNRQCHTNILFSRCRVLKFKDLVDLKALLVLFKIFSSMPIPNNIQCLFSKVTVYVPLDPNTNMYEIISEQILRHNFYRLIVELITCQYCKDSNSSCIHPKIKNKYDKKL